MATSPQSPIQGLYGSALGMRQIGSNIYKVQTEIEHRELKVLWKRLRIPSIILSLLLFSAVVISLAITVIPSDFGFDDGSGDTDSSDANYNFEVAGLSEFALFSYLSIAASVVALLLNITCFFIALKWRGNETELEKANFIIFVLQGLVVLSNLVNLMNPSVNTAITVYVLFGVCFACLITVMTKLFFIRAFSSHASVRIFRNVHDLAVWQKDPSETNAAANQDSTTDTKSVSYPVIELTAAASPSSSSEASNHDEPGNMDERVVKFVNRIATWRLITEARRKMSAKESAGRSLFILLCFIILALTCIMYIWSFKEIVTSQSPFFSKNDLSIINGGQFEKTKPSLRTYDQHKVLIIVIDGLRYDRVYLNDDLAAFVNRSDIKRDAKLWKIDAQLPSMSVPNWVTILTGAPPEMTGFLGNLGRFETNYDHIFRQATFHNLTHGLTASPWWSDIIKTYVAPLTGDGTIPVERGSEGIPYSTTDPADDIRGEVAKQALRMQPPYDYQLFLAHFSDVDNQGHCCGVDKRWNPRDTYQLAVNNKTRIVSELIDLVSDDHIVLITADHGHVLRGGHGGLSRSLREVPLMIYKKNSGFGEMSYTGPTFQHWQTTQSTFLAPTVCALLGMPVPRTNFGGFIEEAMALLPEPARFAAYLDLLQQKRWLIANFLAKTSNQVASRSLPDINIFTDDYTNKTIAEITSAIDALMGYYDQFREASHDTLFIRNILSTIVVIVFLTAYIVYAWLQYTFCELKSILPRQQSPNRRKNIIALIWGCGGVLVYYCLSLVTFIILYTGYGYWSPERNEIWDSTYIHAPQAIPTYILYVVIPCFLYWFIISRLYHGIYTNWYSFDYYESKRGDDKRILPKIRFYLIMLLRNFTLLFVHNRKKLYNDYATIYLIKYYFLIFTIIISFLLMLIASSFTWVIPLIYPIPYISESNWLLRFRVLTLQFISLPLIIGIILDNFLWIPKKNLSNSEWDSVYLLGIRSARYAAKDKEQTAKESGNDMMVEYTPQQLEDFFTLPKYSRVREAKNIEFLL